MLGSRRGVLVVGRFWYDVVGLDSSILSDDERSVIFFFLACVGLSGDASATLRMGQGCPVNRLMMPTR